MPSLRNNAPTSPGLVQRSAANRIRRFSAPETWRRLAVATTSGSAGGAMDGATPVALRAPSEAPSIANALRPIIRSFVRSVMISAYLSTLNGQR